MFYFQLLFIYTSQIQEENVFRFPSLYDDSNHCWNIDSMFHITKSKYVHVQNTSSTLITSKGYKFHAKKYLSCKCDFHSIKETKFFSTHTTISIMLFFVFTSKQNVWIYSVRYTIQSFILRGLEPALEGTNGARPRVSSRTRKV